MIQNRKEPAGQKPDPSSANQPPLTSSEVEHFREMLLAKRKEIAGNVNDIEDETLRKSHSSGDLSSMPIHMADLGTDNYEQDFALGLMDSERKMLQEINDALQRIEEGTYGTCQATGKWIAKMRLEAKPWAKYSMEHTRKMEQGLVPEEEQ